MSVPVCEIRLKKHCPSS